MKSHDNTIPKKKKIKEQKKNINSDQSNADPSEDGRIYGIYHLNMGELSHNLGDDSKWLLAQSREGQMANKYNIINSIKREYNVISSFLIPEKRAKHKDSHYSPIL